MKTQKLWFVRHGGRVSGPFPAKLISQDWMLGRFQGTDEASIDRIEWMAIQDIPDLQPQITRVKNRMVGNAESPLDWERERREAALRWVDERRLPDRRTPEGAQLPEVNRRGEDRRIHPESAAWISLRQRHAATEARLRKKRERFIGISAALLFIAAGVSYAVLHFSPVHPVKVGLPPVSSNCATPAKAQINWARCDKNGAWLKGAILTGAVLREAHFNAANFTRADLQNANFSGSDLSFANLEQAKLNGANLRSANLAYAELRDADLRYADLRGAKLDNTSLIGARLDEATWVDGRKCVAISVGDCK